MWNSSVEEGASVKGFDVDEDDEDEDDEKDAMLELERCLGDTAALRGEILP